MAKRLKLSYAEYVSRENASETRHEFIDGELFAMAGGTPEHSAIIAFEFEVFSEERAERTSCT